MPAATRENKLPLTRAPRLGAEPAIARLGAGAWLKKPYAAADFAEKIREIFNQ